MTRRALPLTAFAAVALVAGLIVGARHQPTGQKVAARYVAAWARADYAEMYRLLDDRARARTSLTAFARAHRAAAATATATAIRFGDVDVPRDGVVTVRARVATRAFGPLSLPLRLPVRDVGGSARVAWRAQLAFPGVRAGEQLDRSTSLPPRATLFARDGTPLAQGPDRSSPLGPVAAEIAGSLGPPEPADLDALRAAGHPADAQVGVSGLERVFEERLAGTPGGELRIGARVVARTTPRPGRPVRTTIDPQVERAAIDALAGRFGGVAAIQPRTGEILALAGVAYSALQPPGSTFKIVTATAALEAGITKPSTVYPAQSAATLDGVRLENANGEICGGTFVEAFAESCNSVFAPLGAKLGARALVDAATRFGFNESPGIPGAATSAIPPADELQGELALGSTAIGQGRVTATTLQVASLAATIATHGRRARPTLVFGLRRPRPRATKARVARTVERLMLATVRSGTGVAAAIPGVRVAGKTGTAELEDKPRVLPGQPAPPPPPPGQPPSTDAWFTAYAPAGRPRIAVAVLLVRAGAGGAVAAPAARGVLIAGLRRGR